MAEAPRDVNAIKETDIVFDCPSCGKSLAIDYRGAGLTIPCTDCGTYVDVPIPEGMEVSDIDSSDEEQEMRILNLRRSLNAAELRIVELEAKHEASEKKIGELARGDGAAGARMAVIQKTVEELRRHLAEMAGGLTRVSDLTRPSDDLPSEPGG